MSSPTTRSDPGEKPSTADHIFEWTCGHVAGAMCAECYGELARRAAELQERVDDLTETVRRLETRGGVTISRACLEHVRDALDQCKAEIDAALSPPEPALAKADDGRQLTEETFGN